MFGKNLTKVKARFHKSVKIMATLTYVCQNIIYVGMAIFRMNSRSDPGHRILIDCIAPPISPILVLIVI